MAGKMAKPKAKAVAKGGKAPQQSPTSRKPARGKGKSGAVDRQQEFVRQYLVDLNGRQAAIRAGYSPDSARFTASELLTKPEVQEAVAKAMVERAQRTGLDADATVARIQAIAWADASEISQIHRNCCRFCWGIDHLFQRTPRELRDARASHEFAERERQKSAAAEFMPAQFDEGGGIGWDPRRDPHPTCPECWGEGELRVVFADTRDLSPSARLLYAGVQQTPHGIKVNMHDQMSMLRDLGRHQGLFRDKVELTGKDGKDLGAGIVVVPMKIAAPEDLGPPPAIEEDDAVQQEATPEKFKVYGKR